MPLAQPRSENGTHLLRRPALVGYAPAWASPQPNRKITSATNECATPMSPVNSDQSRMYSASMPRAPNRSLNQPEGTWARAYVQKNALNNSPPSASLRPNSSLM